jgi:hypothetical protein
MQSTNPEIQLNASIMKLENELSEEKKQIKDQFCSAFESIKPVNIVKSALKEAVGSSDINSLLVQTAGGLIAGYITRKIISNGEATPTNKLIGALVSLGVTIAIGQNAASIKKYSQKIVQWIGSKDDLTLTSTIPIYNSEKTENSNEDRS